MTGIGKRKHISQSDGFWMFLFFCGFELCWSKRVKNIEGRFFGIEKINLLDFVFCRFVGCSLGYQGFVPRALIPLHLDLPAEVMIRSPNENSRYSP